MPSVDYSSVINLDAYPIADCTSAQYKKLVLRYTSELSVRQYCVLPDFIRNESRHSAVQEALAAMPHGYRNTSTRNCYLQRKQDTSVAEDHPANIMFDASYTMLAYDQLTNDSALKQIYSWPAMVRFIKDITGVPELYVSDDPYQPVNVLCSGAGDQSAWHFDSWNAFTMTLLLQAPHAGGEFQLVPSIRTTDDPNYAVLASVLKGNESEVVTVDRDPGSLVIFRGSTSIHRVTEVKGDTPRLMAVFVYENKPGVTGDPQVNETVYGPRVAG